MTVLRVIVGVLVIAVVGLGVSLFVVADSSSSGNSDQARQIRELQTQVRAAQKTATSAKTMAVNTGQQDVTAVKASVSALKESLSSVRSDGRSVGRRVNAIEDCLPEMQTELNSMEVDRYGYLSMSSQVSRVCSPLVYGNNTSQAGDR